MDPTTMSPLARSIYEKLKPSISKSQGSRGKIISYDYITKLATVRGPNPITNEMTTYHLVQVQDQGRGIQFNSLKAGTEVWLSFYGENTPVISSIFTDRSTKEDLKVYYGPSVNRYTGFL